MKNTEKNFLTERYVALCQRLFGWYNAQPLQVSFDRPWWKVISAQPLTWGFVFFSVCVFNSFIASVPLLLGYVLDRGSLKMLAVFLLVWLSIEVMQSLATAVFCFGEVRLMQSVQFQAFKYLLLVDPLYHVSKQRGAIFAKIERAVRAYEAFIDDLLWELLPITCSIITVVFTFFSYDIFLGLMASGILVCIISLNVLGILFNVRAFERRTIAVDDRNKSVMMEGISQVPLIRAAFATDAWSGLGEATAQNTIFVMSLCWVAYVSVNFITRVLYLGSIGLLAWYIFGKVAVGGMSVILATTFLVAYVNATHRIHRIGRMVQKVTQSSVRINDLFVFIRAFGKQTFPVLIDDPRKCDLSFKQNAHADTSIMMTNMHFAYEMRARIFEQHDLHMVVPASQELKLYGIVGPSGAGKTTFLSILGGQLHPEQGTILINNIPVYGIDDIDRRQLIALQGQTASGVRGSVRDNLMLGYDGSCQDAEMVEVLARVGLWGILQTRAGLDSEVGEGGLNLSLGQRQRLNFAALYLRVKRYQPMVVLIDEPTSSLDQVSEQAITQMIREIAKDAVTMVIAHRINTLEQAVGIMDCSLLVHEKMLRFYGHEELVERSAYYRKLLKGEVSLDH